MIERLYIECAGLAVAIRLILAVALWVAASVALGGCASQPRGMPALKSGSMSASASRPAAQRAPAFRVAGPHVAPRLELPIPDQRGEGDLIPRQAGQCEREADAEPYRSIDVRAPNEEEPHELQCDGPRGVIARGWQAPIGG